MIRATTKNISNNVSGITVLNLYNNLFEALFQSYETPIPF